MRFADKNERAQRARQVAILEFQPFPGGKDLDSRGGSISFQCRGRVVQKAAGRPDVKILKPGVDEGGVVPERSQWPSV